MIPVSLLSVVLMLDILGVLPKSEALFSKKANKEHCYAHDRHPYLGFASKTSYEEVYNKAGIAPLKGCRAIQIWMVIRHGTQYPGRTDMPEFEVSEKLKEQVLENHKNKKGSLCEEDLANLAKYKVLLDPEMAYHVSHQDREDLYNLGLRLRESFPEIFVNNAQFKFLFTPTTHIQESVEYFYRGIFGMRFEAYAYPFQDPIKDLIYTHSDCPNWAAATARNKVHHAAFKKSEHMKKVVEGVSRRLGFEEDLSLDEIKIIYDDCRYYEKWNGNGNGKSPWCAAFNKDELITLEYEEDLKYYYKSGPGHPWNHRLSCPMVKDMYDRFSKKAANIEEKNMHRALFYFSHADLLNQLSAGMGLRDDEEPITEYNFLQKAKRNFRTSNIIPFTANILAVLYTCNYQSPDKAVTKIRFYQAEHVVKYPGCPDGICEWVFIKKKFEPYVNDPICTDMSICTEEITKHYTKRC